MVWLIVVTFLFYSLNVTGFNVRGFVLVGNSCIKDEPIDLVFWVPYLGAVVTFIFAPHIGQWILLGLFIFISVVFFFSTYRYWIWPNKDKIARYNKHFSHTHRIIKPKENVLVPDTFHIAIFSLFFINLIAMIVYIIA